MPASSSAGSRSLSCRVPLRSRCRRLAQQIAGTARSEPEVQLSAISAQYGRCAPALLLSVCPRLDLRPFFQALQQLLFDFGKARIELLRLCWLTLVKIRISQLFRDLLLFYFEFFDQGWQLLQLPLLLVAQLFLLGRRSRLRRF